MAADEMCEISIQHAPVRKRLLDALSMLPMEGGLGITWPRSGGSSRISTVTSFRNSGRRGASESTTFGSAHLSNQ